MAVTLNAKRDTEQAATRADVFSVKADVLRLEGKVGQMYWMLGVVIAGMSAMFVKMFF